MSKLYSECENVSSSHLNKKLLFNIAAMEFSQHGDKYESNNHSSPSSESSSSNHYSSGDGVEIIVSSPIIQINVTSILSYCKTKILRPYLRLLSLMGLRPLNIEQDDRISCLALFSHLYTIQVVVFMIIGYVLQYMACFRRDRGFGYRLVLVDPFVGSDDDEALDVNNTYEKICHGSVVFSYGIPNLLHLIAYLCAVFIFRNSDDDQLPSLMEKVFISLSNMSDGFINQKRLVKTLWVFVAISLVWMALSFLTVNFMMAEGIIDFKWMEHGSHEVVILLKVLLIICTLWHDMIQATVVSNYCLQAQLLLSYARFLRNKVLQYPVDCVDWMREVNEFKNLLDFFNRKLAPSVCIFVVINLSYSISGILWTLEFDNLDKETVPIFGICLINILLWIVITFAPIVQAARLTHACTDLRGVGHEVRCRPFPHQHTSRHDLDTLLVFASSMRMRARLYGVPITGRYILAVLTGFCIALLVLGQLHYFNNISII